MKHSFNQFQLNSKFTFQSLTFHSGVWSGFIGIFLLLVLLLSPELYSQNYPSGKSILDKIDNNMSSKNRIITAKMEIEGARGVRTMEFKTWTEGEKKSFTEYLAPAREKGTKMLKLENQLWIFSPSTDRVMQISGHMLRQSVMGSDMSYEDLMNDEPLLQKYTATVTGEETVDNALCWVVTLTAVKEDVNYFTQKIWVDKDRNVPHRMDQYAKGGKLLKRTVLSDIQKIQGRWFPMQMTYKDMLKEGKGTRMIIQKIEFDTAIPAGIFNKANLK